MRRNRQRNKVYQHRPVQLLETVGISAALGMVLLRSKALRKT